MKKLLTYVKRIFGYLKTAVLLVIGGLRLLQQLRQRRAARLADEAMEPVPQPG